MKCRRCGYGGAVAHTYLGAAHEDFRDCLMMDWYRKTNVVPEQKPSLMLRLVSLWGAILMVGLTK